MKVLSSFYLLSFRCCVSGLEVREAFAQLVLLRLRVVVGQEEVRPPVGRIETPVASSILSISVRMTNKLLRAEQPLAVETLDTSSRRRRVRLGQQDPAARAEARVLNTKAEG